MANPGAGTKFVSVNLSKSYGQQQQQYHHQYHSSSYGSNRNRSGGAGGGGGGMVVLSRPRSSQKAAATKLSVPSPLNLPSLRKENEKFDSLGSGAGPTGSGSGTGGVRPSSSGMGWTKPAVIAAPEKDGLLGIGSDLTVDDNSVNHVLEQGPSDSVNEVSKGNNSSLYMPPSVRYVGPAASGLSASYLVPEKATVLRREDFPSLKAALPVVSMSEKKQKDGLNKKQKQVLNEDKGYGQGIGSGLSALVDMRPKLQSRNGSSNGANDKVGEKRGLGVDGMFQKERKQEEYFPEPLPLVRLNPRSHWADDERDTGLGLMDRGIDHGVTKIETYWETDFDFPRPSVLPQKSIHNYVDRRWQRDNEAGKIASSELAKVDNFGRDTRTSAREGGEGNSWRVSQHLTVNGFGTQEGGNERSGIVVRPSSQNVKSSKESKYVPSFLRDTVQDDTGRRDVGCGHGGRLPLIYTMDCFSGRGSDWNSRERYGNEQSRSRRSDYFQNIPAFKSSFSSGGKGLPVNDPILSIGREKRPSSKNEKSHMDDPFMRDFGASGFDGHDPFAGPLVSLVKRKKDVLKQTDFHDPIRESFEAELERVQKMQEKERKRVMEEQERAMELARREEEERIRLAREQRERQRRLEEETREVAWRAEQERLEAIQKAEEQRIAREEEKRRILMEEERRKQAAKQKLLELEERIAKRQAEATKFGDNNSSILSDENMSERARATERDSSKSADTSEWEDGERMVERIKTSTSTDSSGANRAFDMSSRPLLSRDGFSTFLDTGKNHQPWKQDALDNGDNSLFLSNDQGNGHHSPRCDPSVGGRVFSRKETYGGPGCIPSWSNSKGGVPELHKVDFRHTKGQRWNLSGDGDHFSRSLEMESDFHETLSERFGDGRWSRNHSRDGVYPPYHERIYRNSEADEFYPFGRSRYSTRQPRVLPPPSTNSLQRSSYKIGTGHPGPSTFAENEFQYNDRARSESTMQTIFDSGHQENIVESQTCDFHEESTENEAQKTDGEAARCDSQSSLSVSSPPDSPVHLSHDDLDESGDFPVLIADRKDETFALQVNESSALPADGGKDKLVGGLSCDDEEWPIENDNSFQEQEEYDEDEDAYVEEDEVHDAEDENVNLDREFGDHLKGKGLPDMTDNLVLGFNEGVEVGMPNDEFERSLGNEDENFVTPIVSVGNVKELGSFDGICSEGQALQHVTGSTEVVINKSTRIFREAEKKMQDLVIHPKNAPQSSAASEVMNHMDVCSAGLSSQAQIPSTGQTVLSTVPSVHDQTELPVKLQFGLFSGPSLIPSPVPAIQIGSIQMPLHLHSPIAQSVTHVQSSQPLFQFGQLRYTSPISQGLFPLASQSMSFVQPTVPANFPPNQIGGGSVSVQSGRETSHNLTKCDSLSVSIGGKPDVHSQHLGLLSRSMISKGGNRLPLIETSDDNIKAEQGQGNLSCSSNQNLRTESGFQTEDSSMKNFKNLPTKESGGQPQTVSASLQSAAKGKDSGLGNGQGMITGGRRKRYIFTVKNSGSKSSGQLPEVSRQDPGGFQRRPQRQRTEFQVRENADKRKTVGPMSSKISGINDKSNINSKGVRARNVFRRVTAPNRQAKETFESDGLSSQLVAQETDSGTKVEKGAVREPLRKNMSHPGGDVDTSLQSGIVRIFEQHGIEAPSDDDDFIEVRSKRQMLNDRREQREKEIKAKSRTSKTMRKFRPGSQTAVHSITSSKLSASVCGGDSSNPHTEFVASEGHGLENVEVSAGLGAPIVSQPLPPIGTPVKNDVQTEIRSQAIKTNGISSLPVLTGGRKNLSSGLKFENKNKVLDNVQTSLGSWANSQINQQVVTITQAQFDEAMKPGQFDSDSSVGDHTNSIGEPSLTSSSILTKDKSFASAPIPINSLLSGNKIEFGAVTSPSIIPPSSCSVACGIVPLGACRPDIQMTHNLSATVNQCSLFLGKDKRSYESSVHLEDCEAEAEAAASAVAVAAISSDEIIGNGLGTSLGSSSDSKNFEAANANGDQHLGSRSRAEESLSVALPADLSVETTPIPLWPPLPSPQHSCSQMLSHVPGGTPSHFPLYEMNPMLGGPILAFGPHDESASTQSQPHQKSNTPVSGPHGTWQHHSGVDSFYGHPAGFTAPFISPTGSIPGVQGPPHMVVYNHFAPVGQFGQVGLSFMGAAYIPSGKQPDWKHNPASSAMGSGEGEMNNLNIVSAQRSTTNIPAPAQQLAPGASLVPIASPLAMFDVSPFQSAPDMSVQARWSHVPASPLQSVSVSMPLQQQSESVHAGQFNHGHSVDQSLAAKKFPESQMLRPSDNDPDATVNQLPDELGLEASSSNNAGTCAHGNIPRSQSAITVPDAGKTQSGSASNSCSQNTSSALKTQPPQSRKKKASTQHFNTSSNNYQRNSSGPGGEWSHSHCRTGFQGRTQPLGGEKNFPPSKSKQIYVAKQTSSASSTT